MKLLLMIVTICISLTIGFIYGLKYDTICSIEVSDVNHNTSILTKRCYE